MEKKRSKLNDPLSRILSGLLIPIDVLREHSSDADSWDSRTDGFRSPVPHLFTSNTPPSEEEKLRIQEVLVAARKSEVTALLKLERSKVDDRLRDDLSEKQRFIHDHEQLLSCLRTFPPELLECVFKFCLFDPEEWPPKDRRRPASFSLSHVCKRWREVALDVPYLWSYLPRIRFSTWGTTAMDLDLLEAVLLRSKDKDLWLHFEPASDHEGNDCELAAIKKLAGHAYRLRGLVIQSNFTVLDALCSAQKLLQRNSGPAFSRLQKLGLHPPEYFSDGLIPWFSEFDSPNLREVSISGNTKPRDFGITHSGLTVFRATIYPGTSQRQNINDILNRSEETLERLELRLIALTSRPRIFDAPISMKNLRHLSIRYNVQSPSNTILQELELPVLESLSLENYCPRSLVSDIKALKGVNKSLRRLHLRAKMGPGRLIRVLKSAPNIEEIDISLPPHRDLLNLGDPNLLKVASGDSQLVPHLKKITFYSNLPVQNALNQETISALSAIGELRFKCQASITNCPMRHHAYQKLERFSILIRGHQTLLYDAMCLLNQWRSGGHPVDDRELVRLGTTLRNSERQIQDLEWEKPGKRESVADMRWWKKLEDTFDLIKTYNLTSTQGDIYLSGLPIILQDIVQLTRPSVRGTKRYIVHDWAESILRNWEGQLLADISKSDTTFLWTMEEGRGVVYIPADHPMRTSADAVRLLSGLEAEQISGAEDAGSERFTIMQIAPFYII